MLSVLIFTYKTFIVCQSCHRANKEAKHVGTHLHHFGFNTQVLQEKIQIKLFSLKVLHQKVIFTPCGLFQVDLKLMFTVCIMHNNLSLILDYQVLYLILIYSADNWCNCNVYIDFDSIRCCFEEHSIWNE